MRANGQNLKLAEKEARVVGALIAAKRCSWEPYTNTLTRSKTVKAWLQRFEEAYFQRRSRSPKTETTLRYNYQKVFGKLPPEKILTVELMRDALTKQSQAQAHENVS